MKCGDIVENVVSKNGRRIADGSGWWIVKQICLSTDCVTLALFSNERCITYSSSKTLRKVAIKDLPSSRVNGKKKVS